MNVNTIIFIYFLATTSLVVYFYLHEKKYRITERKLFNLLISVAKFLNIPITYHDVLGDAAGAIYYFTTDKGVFIADSANIKIKNEYKERPSVLAHELGHYLSLKKYNDNSEQKADQQALELCEAILTKKEKRILKIFLNVYFKNTTK